MSFLGVGAGGSPGEAALSLLFPVECYCNLLLGAKNKNSTWMPFISSLYDNFQEIIDCRLCLLTFVGS